MENQKIKWIEATPETVDFYGVNAKFERLPLHIAQKVSQGVADLANNPAGGRIRFATDSETIYIKAHVISQRGIGFDLYRVEGDKEIFAAGFRRPKCFICDGDFEASAKIGNGEKVVSYTLNFPYIGVIDKLEFGIDERAVLRRGAPYRNEKPVVFYGSSITQGAWATRPGMTYEAMISQRYNLNYTNLGFSGNAKGEQEIANYMATLEMCAFVCDYDHNSPSVEHLKKTHLPLYKTIRKAHPDIPYLIITRPDWYSNPVVNQNLADVIYKTYEYAKANGDKNVRFIVGKTLFNGDYYHNCTKDGCHPNDLGFYRMASVIGPEIASMLGIEGGQSHDTHIY